MDSYYQFGRHGDRNCQNTRRVYLNPNFQSGTSSSVLQTGRSTLTPHNRQSMAVPEDSRSTSVPQIGSMYLNPNFHYNNLQLPKTNKPKIYVNPNFVRANTSVKVVNDHYATPVATSTMSSYYGMANAPAGNARASMSSYYDSAYRSTLNTLYVNSKTSTVTSTDSLQMPNVTPKVTPQHNLPVAVAKSRYSLVRQNNNATSNVGLIHTNKPVTKMKISKYKTVSIEHVKKLQTQNNGPVPKILPQTNAPIVAEKSRRIFRNDVTNSRFKLIKNNIATKVRRAESMTPIKRKSLNSYKIMLGSKQKLKMRVDNTVFKKNNIPCPLFRKYGTCLRNSRGKCEFLHDKKHVSICRKFLKGICHDKNCLLSHEITAEKMPTCSFYLNGMCTREDCPYLHVKLNEKTKICLDFLKGYCDKGNECLNRHVNICPDQAMKGSCLRKKCPYPHRNNKRCVNKINTRKVNIKSKINKKINKKENIAGNESVQSEVEDKDCRYYKEVVEDTAPVEVEVIKPSRCKLGALPSFIQL